MGAKQGGTGERGASALLTTAMEERDHGARFVVVSCDPLYQDRLAHMGYLSIGGDRFATRWFPNEADPLRYYERFAASIETMVLQSARLVPIPWEDALLVFLRRVENAGLSWWLYGSGALAVRGLNVAPGDLDIHTSDALRTGHIFDDLLVTPVEHLDGWVAKSGGRAFHHAIIEWLSEPRAEHDDPACPHEQGPFIATQLETVSWRGHIIRVPPLTAQLRVCERRDLTERATVIREALQP